MPLASTRSVHPLRERVPLAREALAERQPVARAADEEDARRHAAAARAGSPRADRRPAPARTRRPTATAFARSRAASSGVGEEALDRAASASTSPGSTSRPFSPSRTTSATPPVRVAITGVPTASASTTRVREVLPRRGEQRRVAGAEELEHAGRGSGPRKRAWPRRSSAARSGPSPAIASATPARRAASIPTSSDFCARQPAREDERRPVEAELARAAPRAARSSGIGGAGFGSTRHAVGRARPSRARARAGTPTASRRERRGARRRRGRAAAAASRGDGRGWNSSSDPRQSPQRRARSNAGSAVSLITNGVRASRAPSEERPSIPGRVDDVGLPGARAPTRRTPGDVSDARRQRAANPVHGVLLVRRRARQP